MQTINFCLAFILSLIFLPVAHGQGVDPMYSPGILQDVISESRSPRAYDWRKNSYELQLGYGYTDEANNFENEIYELILGLPSEGGLITRVGLRRAIVMGTNSSDKIGRTPFTQESTMTRYEIVAGLGFSLLEGRNFTRLSPSFGDFENVVMAWAGFHYSHPNASYIPKKNEKPKKMPGQNAKNFKYVIELGLRWAIYTPKDYGLYMEAMYHLPLGSSGDLKNWNYFAGGIAIAVD
jgi:hypothetical protein